MTTHLPNTSAQDEGSSPESTQKAARTTVSPTLTDSPVVSPRLTNGSTGNRGGGIAGLARKVNQFFYGEEVPYGMAIVRILLPIALLVPMAPRWFFAREIYSLDGAPTPLWESYGYQGMLPLFSGGVIVALHTALLVTLITSIIGWCTRFSLIAATVLYTYINLCDAVSTITKYSCIASHGLLLLSLSSCGSVWSVDRWLQKRRLRAAGASDAELQPQASAVWPRRLLQLMIAYVYFGAAFTKMQTPAYFSGDQLMFWMITHVNEQHPLGEWMVQFPTFVQIGAYITFVWEVVFIFLAWRGMGRRLCIGLGVFFHLMTTLTLGLYVFPMVCISIYFAFASEHDVLTAKASLLRFKAWLTRSRSSLDAPTISPAGLPGGISTGATPQLGWSWSRPQVLSFAATMIVLMSLGVIAEHKLDRYGLRRAEGLHTLTPIDPSVVRQMLARTEPIRESDKIFTFDTGTGMVGGFLTGRRDVFRQGEVVSAQVNLTPPREDMYIECELRDDRQRVLGRKGYGVPRAEPRTLFSFQLTEAFPPGEYTLRLLSSGQPVATRTFTLVSKDGSQPTYTAADNSPRMSAN